MFGVAIGSLKPLIDWKIEQKRQLRDERKLLLSRIRILLSKDPLEQFNFINTVEYSQIRPLLSKELIDKLETHTKEVTIRIGHRRYGADVELMDRIHEIENRWNLL